MAILNIPVGINLETAVAAHSFLVPAGDSATITYSPSIGYPLDGGGFTEGLPGYTLLSWGFTLDSADLVILESFIGANSDTGGDFTMTAHNSGGTDEYVRTWLYAVKTAV